MKKRQKKKKQAKHKIKKNYNSFLYISNYLHLRHKINVFQKQKKKQAKKDKKKKTMKITI